ncbi:prepilin peptidase [Microvirga sp. 0TCS3.31]
MSISAASAFIAGLSFGGTVIWAGIMDLRTMRIRNELVLFLIGVYAALAPLAGWSVGEIGMSAAASAGVLVCAFICFGFGWIGGGDAKLASVIVLWLGAEQTMSYLFWAALGGGALTLIVLQFRAMALPSYCLRYPWIMRLHDKRVGVPYGVALAAAALVVFPETSWMKFLS